MEKEIKPYKSRNGNVWFERVIILLILGSILWSFWNAPIILFYTIPLLFISLWVPRETIITDCEIVVNYPYRVFNNQKKIPIDYIKKISNGGSHYDIQSGYFYTVLYYTKKTNYRFKLEDESQVQIYIRNKDDVNILFNFFRTKGIKIMANIPKF